MSDARRRAEEALALPGDDPVRKWAVFGCLHQMISEIGEEKALRSLLAEEDERGAVAAEIAGLPVHFVAHLPRGRVFMHPDTPKSGARDAWPPPMPSMIPVPIAPAPSPAPDEAGAMDSRCGDCPAREGEPCQTETGNPLWDVHPSRRPAPPPAADEVREAAERLTRDDAMTLIGHAEYLRRVHGETDMPRFFDGLAKRLLSALAARGGA